MMLQSANVEEEPAPLDITPFLDMPLIGLVEHIERVHHQYLRDNLPRLTAMTGAVASAFPDNDRLANLRDEVQSLAAELDAHLAHEEEALFPRALDAQRNLQSAAAL